MRLDICLIFEVDPVLITEVVPVRSWGIVRIADVIDIRTLHQEDLTLHLLTRHGVSPRRIGLVTICPLELDGLMIYIEVATSVTKLIQLSRSITNLHLAETRIERGTIKERLPRFIIQLSD